MSKTAQYGTKADLH